MKTITNYPKTAIIIVLILALIAIGNPNLINLFNIIKNNIISFLWFAFLNFLATNLFVGLFFISNEYNFESDKLKPCFFTISLMSIFLLFYCIFISISLNHYQSIFIFCLLAGTGMIIALQSNGRTDDFYICMAANIIVGVIFTLMGFKIII